MTAAVATRAESSASIALQPSRPVIPGDRIQLALEQPTNAAAVTKVRVGPGLHQERGDLVAVKAGVLHQGPGNRWWIDGTQKRYVPAVGESVIGTIVAKVGEDFRVEIGSAHRATVNYMAFEGASRKNRPNLDVGSLVYCRVTVANKDMEPEVECMDASGRSAGFGELKGGFVLRCSLRMARSLLDPKNPILVRLAEVFSFETAVGLNGRVWVNAESPAQVIAASRAIQAADGAAATDVLKKVNSELRHYARGMEAS
ncbi:exosome non-catalytic core subunit rrp40 [Thoreauomyces humboldtii]|nr:exosome non-catalytic core subunit rrp40 [Thoreauomyces humboldtii]